MKFKYFVYLICAVIVSGVCGQLQSKRHWVTTDELENHINPDDLRDFLNLYADNATTTEPQGDLDSADPQEIKTLPSVPDLVDCFGLGSISRSMLKFFNMKPDNAEKVNTHFFFTSRVQPIRVQVFNDAQFGLEYVDFKPERRTFMIVHGFMSHSNASWVHDMTRAFLEWGDVNVIAVDWSGGGNTWKYWRAVANTRRVGEDITRFLKKVTETTGANVKNFHFVGHSLGAHIASFASYQLGGVSRITGLDPAQPCFATSNDVERLDASDADFVDIIHTNGRMLKKIGFGMPEAMGHADFYPNGGLRQPGCISTSRSMWSRMISNTKLNQAVCSHGRAYVLFTESLINSNCSFRAYRWDGSYNGVNTSLNSTCDRRHSCAEMGINAAGVDGAPRAKGGYFVLTTDKEPYCVSGNKTQAHLTEILQDLLKAEQLQTTTAKTEIAEYADPDEEANTEKPVVQAKSWWSRIWFGSLIF